MRELTVFELNLVSGAKEDSNKASYTDGINFGAGLGGGIASLSQGASGDLIARGAARGGLVGLAGVAGWNFGTYLYEDTRVGDWVRTGIDKVTGLDKAGIEYDDANTTSDSTGKQSDKSGSGYGN